MAYDPQSTEKNIYKLTEDDSNKIATGRFQANFAVQTATLGDYLSLVGDGDSAEVYVMVEDKVRNQYVPVETPTAPRFTAGTLIYGQWNWLQMVQPKLD